MTDIFLALAILSAAAGGYFAGRLMEMRYHMSVWQRGFSSGIQDHHDVWCESKQRHGLEKPSAIGQKEWDEAGKERVTRRVH